MSHKKAGGSSRNGRDSEAKRLGVKKYGGQEATFTQQVICSQELAAARTPPMLGTIGLSILGPTLIVFSMLSTNIRPRWFISANIGCMAARLPVKRSPI